MELSAQQLKQLRNALIDAFPKKSSLEHLLYFELARNLNAIAGDSDLQDIAFKLIQTAEAEGWVEDLVRAARDSNPGNSQLQAIAQELCVSLPNIHDRDYIPEYDIPDLHNKYIDTREFPISTISPNPSFKPTLVNPVDIPLKLPENYIIKELRSEHNTSNLLSINIRMHNGEFENDKKKFLVVLDVGFGEEEEKFQYKKPLDFREREGYIKFGIKFGVLHFNLTSGCMPLHLRKCPNIEQIFGLLSSLGTEKEPRWQFKVNENKSSTLFGFLPDLEMGILSLQDNFCLVEATFQIPAVNSNNLEVTAQEGVWNDETNKKVKETKLRAFFKRVVEPKLKDYVSKVILQYESTSKS